MTGVPTFVTQLRPHTTFALLCCVLSLACSRPKPAPQTETDHTGQAETALTGTPEGLATGPDVAPLAGVDAASRQPDLPTTEDVPPPPLDARERETAATPDNPLDLLPTSHNPLPAGHVLEALYQCVESNLAQIPVATWQRRIHVQLAVAMARRDPPRGLAALTNATASKPLPEESAAVVLAVGTHDLRRAVTMAAGFSPPQNRRRALEELAGAAAVEEARWAVVISDLMHQRIPREIFLLHLIEGLSQSHSEDSTLLAERIIEPLLNDWAVALLAAAEAPQKLQEALGKIETIESPVVRDWALLRLSLGLAASAPEQVDELIPQVQRSLVRDELISHLALAVIDSTPERALAIALRIEDPELRRRGLDAVARALLPHKPALARFMFEKKREPPLAPAIWLPWLESACRTYPEAAPAILDKTLSDLPPHDSLAGLLNCCPGAPKAVRAAASIRDILDDRLTRCYVCAGIMPDGLVAARTVQDARVRDETLLCALEGLPAKQAGTFKLQLTNLSDPLLKDLAAVALVAKLRTAHGEQAALEVAGAIVDPFLRAPALAGLTITEDKDVASTAKQAFATAVSGIKDSWRRDAAKESLVRALWSHDEELAWHTLASIEDLELLSDLLGELMVQPLPADRITALLARGTPGAPAALACLRSIAIQPLTESPANE